MTLQTHLEQFTVADLCARDVPRLSADAAISAAVAAMQKAWTGAALIMDGDRLAGIFTERDLLRHLAGGNTDLRAPVRTVMTPNPAVLAPDDSIMHALDLMSGREFRNLPVVDKAGRVMGIVRMGDILRRLAEALPQSVLNQPPTPERPAGAKEGA
jgi:CBS domain-containing protein